MRTCYVSFGRALPHLASEMGEWFSEEKIHPIERRCMSEFFSGRSPFKTPEVRAQA